MQIQTEITFDHITNDFSGSLKRQRYVETNGIRENVGEPHRLAVAPGDIDKVRQFIYESTSPTVSENTPFSMPDDNNGIIRFFNYFWTEGVVNKYRASHPEMPHANDIEPCEESESAKTNQESTIQQLTEVLSGQLEKLMMELRK